MNVFADWLLPLLAIASAQQGAGELSTPAPRTLRQREPIVSPTAASDLSRLTFTELATRMPADPWIWNRSTNQWDLKPEAQELRRRVDTHAISDEEWRMALANADVVHTRASWPVGEPLYIWIRPLNWIPCSRITAHAMAPELGTVVCDDRSPSRCGNCREPELARQSQLKLEPFPPSTARVAFEITIEQLNRPSDYLHRDDVKLIWRGRLDVPVRSTATVEEVLPAKSDSDLDRAVRASVRASRQSGDGGLFITAGGEYATYPELEGIGLSLAIELRHRGEFIQRTELIVNRAAVQLRSRDLGLNGFATIAPLPPDFSSRDRQLSEWELRVVGTPKGLLSLWEADRRWNGQFVVTLDQLMSTPK
jgi:hypothetical protein